MEASTGSLLGGRVAYRQLRDGHRTGFEPVLLAASVRAKPGDRVLEAGTGAGAALLCLAARVPGISGIGLERDGALAQIANENFKINGLKDVVCIQGDVAQPPFLSQSFDHILANPPWFDSAGTASPDARRALAHQAGPELLQCWGAALSALLKPKGSLTLILPAASFSAAAAMLRAMKCGGITLFPLWPRAGDTAKMAIISGIKGSKNPDRVLPGLVLHDAAGITAEAQRLLRDAQAISSELNTA